MAYIQHNNPFAITSCGRRRQFMNDNAHKYVNSPGKDRTEESPYKEADPRRTIGPGKNFNKANKTGTGADAGGGMTQKGVNEYKRNNPGSKLKTAVTTDPSKLKKGSKAANRRKSFCARSKSWTSERGKAARRRWNC
jgi:hypothetical protein